MFKIENGNYARENAFWTCQDLVALSRAQQDAQVSDRDAQIARIRTAYDDLSAVYQATKADNDIPLS